MSSQYEIPLTPEAQIFSITLANIDYVILLCWNGYSNNWNLTLFSADGVTVILSNIPLITGTDLFGQYEYLKLGGQLIAETDGDIGVVPSYENLGINSHLYFIVP